MGERERVSVGESECVRESVCGREWEKECGRGGVPTKFVQIMILGYP